MPAAQTPASKAPAQSQASPAQLNMMARNLILRGGQVGGKYMPPAIDVWQPQNPPAPNNPGPGSVLTFYVRNVGLVKRLYVLFNATITTPATSGNALTLTPWGLSNFISNVSFFDLGNNQRINTSGWHLTAIASAKRRSVFGSNLMNDNPFGYGGTVTAASAGANVTAVNAHGTVNNNAVQSAPGTIAADGGTGNISLVLEIPFVKNDVDLRGAIYADVTQATMQVQVTLNPNMFVPSGADPTLAMYQSASASIPTSLTSFTYQVYQNYLDQLPRNPQSGAPILPQLDIATAYLLNTSASGLPVANQDNAAAFVNSRSYESVTFAYDNNGTLNVNGSDINYINLQSANFTNILNLNGQVINMMGRNVIQEDWPAGMYYLDFRHRPIDTNQYGNMQLVVNPSTVTGSGANILYGWEAYGIIGLVNQGGSIPLGGG